MMTPLHGFTALLLLAGAYKQQEILQKGTILVACSNRNKNSVVMHFSNELWQKKYANLAYENKPNVTTLDLEKAVNPGNHIIADLSKPITYTKKYNAIYLERPLTTVKGSSHPNIVNIYCKHLLPLLTEGYFTIEWDPMVGMLDSTHKNTAKAELHLCSYVNPFTGYFNIDSCLEITSAALKKGPCTPTQDTQETFCIKKIQELLGFYAANQSATIEQLHERLELEMKLIQISQLDKYKHLTLCTEKSTTESIQSFNESTHHAFLLKDNNGTFISDTAIPLTQPAKPIKKSNSMELAPFEQQLTLFHCLWSDITILMNGQQAIECLQKLGLKNVTLWRGTSPYNGRKNVWLLRGYKKSREDLILDETDAELRALLHKGSYKQ